MKLSKLTSLTLGSAMCLLSQANFTPPTPLFREVMRNNTAAAKQHLAEGADPNHGRIAGFSAIFFPVMQQNVELFRAMVAKGADLQAKDRLGSTLLMWATFDEAGRTAMLEELLKLGMDPNARNSQGETALTWALRRGDTPIVQMLRKAGAVNSESLKAAVQNAISVLEKSGPSFVKVSGCVSCHHQAVPQMAFSVARSHGFAIDEQIAQQQVKAVMGIFTPMREAMERGTESIPDPEISVSYSLLGLAGQAYPADATTAAMAHLVSTLQRPDGSFRTLPARPPIESSDFTATALSVRAIQLYGKPSPERIELSASWLRTAEPRSTEDRAMQLLGLHWAGAKPSLLEKSAQALLADQRPDGAWAQLPGLETDAYATGQALVALRRAGVLAASDAAYQRGIDFLMRTQMSDGSWLVRTRSFPVQTLKESGFPHARNQWISAAGTGWAIMALSMALPEAQDVSKRPNW
jgi:hypothetical protein